MTCVASPIPKSPKVAARVSGAGSGWRPVSGPCSPASWRSRFAYCAPGMWPAAKACAPHSGRVSSKRQSMMTQRGVSAPAPSACGASSSGSMSVVNMFGRLQAHFRRCALVVTIGATMTIEVFWGSGSPYAWRVLLALEHKRLAYVSHLLQFSKQEHKSPQMLVLNPRGRVPVIKDGDYVCFESLAILYYLDLKYPQPPIFGRTPEEAGTIMRVICEYQAYIEPHLGTITDAIFFGQAEELGSDRVTAAMHAVASEARTIEGRLSKSEWIVGDAFSAVDMVIFPGIQLLKRALERPVARELSSRFMPVEVNYPALGRWLIRVAALPGYERTYPPHWR